MGQDNAVGPTSIDGSFFSSFELKFGLITLTTIIAVNIMHLSGVRPSVCPVVGQSRSTSTAALAAARRFSMRSASVSSEPCELAQVVLFKLHFFEFTGITPHAFAGEIIATSTKF